MAFDWVSFLESYNIEYSEQGSDNIYLRDCPYCGSEGRQFHLGISTKGKGWHCWRNNNYKGKIPHRLIIDLLGCSFLEAQRIVSSGNEASITEGSFSDEMMRKLGVNKNKIPVTDSLKYLEEFRPITDTGLCKKLAFPYLEKRGYNYRDVLYLSERYNLQFTTKGKFAYRIIIPVIMYNQLVNWTGRTVTETDDLRYKSLSSDSERSWSQDLPVAPKNIKSCLFDYDNVRKGGNTLVICEGPFDSMRINYFGEKFGVRSTCLFGVSSVTPEQLILFSWVFDKYSNFVVLFDSDASVNSFSMFPDYFNFSQRKLPTGYKDPGELDFDGFRKLFDIV